MRKHLNNAIYGTPSQAEKERQKEIIQNMKPMSQDELDAAADAYFDSIGLDPNLFQYGVASEEERNVACSEMTEGGHLMEELEQYQMEMYFDEIKKVQEQRCAALTKLNNGIPTEDITTKLNLNAKETAWLKEKELIQEVDLGDGPVLCGPKDLVYRDPDSQAIVYYQQGAVDYFDSYADDIAFDEDHGGVELREEYEDEDEEIAWRKQAFDSVMDRHQEYERRQNQVTDSDYKWLIDEKKQENQKEREVASANIAKRSSWNHPTYSREEILKESRKIYGETTHIRSRILEWFTPEFMARLHRLVFDCDLTYGDRVRAVQKYMEMNGIDYQMLGTGTNRIGVKIGGYVVKFGLDSEGCIDNCREYMYAMRTPNRGVSKTYEVTVDGFIVVCEFGSEMDAKDFAREDVQDMMSDILEEMQTVFMIGDVGIDPKNSVNWAWRDNGEPFIIDYAYIYDINSDKFTCECGGSYHYSNRKFTELTCNHCKKKVTFMDIRNRITESDQKKEIGDMRKRGYIVRAAEQDVPFDVDFQLDAYDETIEKMNKKWFKKYRGEERYEMENPELLLKLDPKWRRNTNPFKKIEFYDDPEIRKLVDLYMIPQDQLTYDDKMAILSFNKRIKELKQIKL